MAIHNFEYVPKEEWKPVRDELFEIIRRLQNEVRDKFTFRYDFVGSSERKMITRDRNSNTGFDFDVNIEVNDPDDFYSPKEIRNILRSGLDRVTNPCGWQCFGYGYTEDSTRVLTLKVKDSTNSRILHSCDFCIIYECGDGRQQYIRYNKTQNSYSWEYQPKGYDKLTEAERFKISLPPHSFICKLYLLSCAFFRSPCFLPPHTQGSPPRRRNPPRRPRSRPPPGSASRQASAPQPPLPASTSAESALSTAPLPSTSPRSLALRISSTRLLTASPTAAASASSWS